MAAAAAAVAAAAAANATSTIAVTPAAIIASGAFPQLCLTNSILACPNFPSYRFYVPGFAVFNGITALLGFAIVAFTASFRAIYWRRTGVLPSAVVTRHDASIVFGSIHASFHTASAACLAAGTTALTFTSVSLLGTMAGYIGVALFLESVLERIARWDDRMRRILTWLPALIILPIVEIPIRLYHSHLIDDSLTHLPTPSSTATLIVFARLSSISFAAANFPYFGFLILCRVTFPRTMRERLGPYLFNARREQSAKAFEQEVRPRAPRNGVSLHRSAMNAFVDSQSDRASSAFASSFSNGASADGHSFLGLLSPSAVGTGASSTFLPPPSRNSRFGDPKAWRSWRLPKMLRASRKQPLSEAEQIRELEHQVRIGTIKSTKWTLDFFLACAVLLLLLGIAGTIAVAVSRANPDAVFLGSAFLFWGTLFLLETALFASYIGHLRNVVHEYFELFPTP